MRGLFAHLAAAARAARARPTPYDAFWAILAVALAVSGEWLGAVLVAAVGLAVRARVLGGPGR